MKYLSICISIVALMLSVLQVYSQEVTVRFIGRLNNANYCRVDSIAVENITRGWSETIQYPDTIIVFSSLNGMAMDVAVGQGLGQNVPNPFNCETSVELSLSQNENVRMQLLDAFGKIYAEYSGNLNAGVHTFDISAASPQTYVLNAVVGSRSYSIRMVNIGNGCGSSIKYAGGFDGIRAKLESVNEFHVGDNMRYVGYASIDGVVEESAIVEQVQASSEDITLNFTHNFESYVVVEQIACGSYTWIDGNTYTESTDAPTVTFTNAAGYDSVVNLHLTITCLPEVQADEAADITDSTATLSGYIVTDNGLAVTERGFVYGRSINSLSNIVQVDVDSASYSANISGLKARRRYYYRAYATNSDGTRYGELRSFDTPFTPIIRSSSFIPDGGEVCYNYNLVVDSIFYEGATVTSVNDIERVYLNIEHSYLGDLSIMVQCPNGQQCLLHARGSVGTIVPGWSLTTINNSGSNGGSNIHLGLAPDPPESNDCYYTAGEGYEYNFTPTATQPMGTNSLNNNTTSITYTDPCGNTESGINVLDAGNYATYESLESLVGCPLNGDWTLYICDHQRADNGWIFEWGVFFDEDLFAPIRGDVSMPTLDVSPTNIGIETIGISK